MPTWPFHSLVAVVATAAAMCFLTDEVRSADASSWKKDQHSAARLVGGVTERSREGVVWRAAVQITLDAGWKTYWRYPGDSGIPPRFNFSGSTNTRDVRVLWPAPMRFSDGVGMSIGYENQVVLPLRIRPRDPAAPVTLRLKLDYAVCEKLCVPVDANLELPLDGVRSAHEDLIRSSTVRVPRKALIGDEGPLAITSVRRQGGPKPGIAVEVRSPDTADLFAEGPNEQWSLPLPEFTGEVTPGLRRFWFALDGTPADAKTAGAQITLTAVSKTDAVEVAFYLD